MGTGNEQNAENSSIKRRKVKGKVYRGSAATANSTQEPRYQNQPVPKYANDLSLGGAVTAGSPRADDSVVVGDVGSHNFQDNGNFCNRVCEDVCTNGFVFFSLSPFLSLSFLFVSFAAQM